MIADWNKLTIADLNELSRIAEMTCGFEITSLDGYSGEIKTIERGN